MSEWTEERRREKSKLMKRLWSDPAFAAKAREGLARGNRNRWDDPLRRQKDLDQLHYQRCSPGYVNYPRIRLQDPRQAELHSKLLESFNSDPILIERRKKAIKKLWSDPAYRARMAAKNRRMNDKKRGFHVPKHLWPEYRRLVKKKLLSARQAGQILGLIST